MMRSEVLYAHMNAIPQKAFTCLFYAAKLSKAATHRKNLSQSSLAGYQGTGGLVRCQSLNRQT